jgi:hypothetical protein
MAARAPNETGRFCFFDEVALREVQKRASCRIHHLQIAALITSSVPSRDTVVRRYGRRQSAEAVQTADTVNFTPGLCSTFRTAS